MSLRFSQELGRFDWDEDRKLLGQKVQPVEDEQELSRLKEKILEENCPIIGSILEKVQEVYLQGEGEIRKDLAEVELSWKRKPGWFPSLDFKGISIELMVSDEEAVLENPVFYIRLHAAAEDVLILSSENEDWQSKLEEAILSVIEQKKY